MIFEKSEESGVKYYVLYKILGYCTVSNPYSIICRNIGSPRPNFVPLTEGAQSMCWHQAHQSKTNRALPLGAKEVRVKVGTFFGLFHFCGKGRFYEVA